MGIIFGALIVILGGTYLYLNRYISKYPENKVADNVYVGPIAAGNMTKAELKDAMTAHLETKKATKVTLKIDSDEENASGRSDRVL